MSGHGYGATGSSSLRGSGRGVTSRGALGRILGDQRRETAEAAAAAARASRRAALAVDDDDDGDEDENAYGVGALGDDEGGMFADTIYEEDDREADEIYAAVDARMESRRKRQREERVAEDLRKYREQNPTIRMQFADVRAGLEQVTADEWAALPDIGDYGVKKRRYEKYTPAPDSLLDSVKNDAAAAAFAQTPTNLAAIGAGRSSVLGQKLDMAGGDLAGGVGAKNNVDALGYLSEMAGVKINSASEIGDIKKARLLLKSVTNSNPKHAPGWIAAARLEEVAGKASAARALAAEGCRRCPRNEDVWLEAARLYPTESAKRVLAQAVAHVPRSEKIWLQAAALENENRMKRRVLRKALEIIPQSALLWRAAVDLEEHHAAKILLSRAVECVPKATDLWLALAKLQKYEDAKRTLSKAREAVPKDPSVWITAARLEEVAHGEQCENILKLLREAVQSLKGVVKREQWFSEARDADKANYPGTCAGIVRAAAALDVEDSAREDVWLNDAEDAEKKECTSLARAVYSVLTETFPARHDLWRRAAEFEKRVGNGSSQQEKSQRVVQVLSRAVGYCPQGHVLWLMLAKEEYTSGNINGARDVLNRAFLANPSAEHIWLAAAKVETECREFERARTLLAKARLQAPSAQVYMKSAMLERMLGKRDAQLELLQEGLEQFPDAFKLWLMLGQWHELHGATRNDALENAPEPLHADARAVYNAAIEKCAYAAPLWTSLADLEERAGNTSKARAVLERGRQALRHDKNNAERDLLWRAAAYLEVRCGRANAAQDVLARALKECPKSQRLWALYIALASSAERRSRTKDALAMCSTATSAMIVLEAARALWRERAIDKARAWIERCVQIEEKFGDAWGALLALERAHGDTESVRKVEERVQQLQSGASLKGDVWTAVKKAAGHELWDNVKIVREVANVTKENAPLNGRFYQQVVVPQ